MDFSIQVELPRHRMSTVFPYSTTQVAKMLPCKKLNGNIKLRKFLRENNIMEGEYPVETYVELGYFYVEYRYPIPFCRYAVPVIKVSTAGYVFIKKLVQEKLECKK